MKWCEEKIDPKARVWEDLYRGRWQYDKVVRSTHGVNCTGSCSWNVYVKNGIVAWEMQAGDYPAIDTAIPKYEPRGCPRGMSFSWYIYSPLRVKYPYIRGALLDVWEEEKNKSGNAASAWKNIIENKETRTKIQQARGKGGFRRASWDLASEIIAAAVTHTVKKHGPDRIVGFSPIPAMSMVSYAAGARFLNLLGGVVMSFYDWYSDLPPASPETWGEQTDVAESADWFHSKFIASVGSNISQTRTPDAHFLTEARHNGTKVVVFSPEFSPTAKQADEWINIKPGQDGAFWLAVNHVILNEYFHSKETTNFSEYLKKYSDAAFLVVLEKSSTNYKAGKYLRAAELVSYKNLENSEWKLLVFNSLTNSAAVPYGSMGHRWQNKKGAWNLKLEDELSGGTISPQLTFIKGFDEVAQVEFTDFCQERKVKRGVPAKRICTEKGDLLVTTVFDLLNAQFGVSRGLSGDYPAGYDSQECYTPGWQESFTGVPRETVLNFAREWADTALKTGGKCMVLIGAGVNHWYHADLIYRGPITALILCGCVGKNGGGWNHYVGQEKVAPLSSWVNIAMAADWGGPARLQNTPSFHYIHSSQWRYDHDSLAFCPSAADTEMTALHPADMQVKAVRMGWLPFFPQFDKNPLNLAKDYAQKDISREKYVANLVEDLKTKRVNFAVAKPDASENWPRVWFIWRANALMSSAKGQEYFLKHYLGTEANFVTNEVKKDLFKEIEWQEHAAEGKFDLIVDLDFRMNTSALYSDIVLPAATWYEKNDLSTTDMHSFIHPLTAAVPPCWESKSDFEIFKLIAKKFSEMAETAFAEPELDVVMSPLLHDTPAEIAQPSVRDWMHGECEAIPGKTMPAFTVVERDYKNLFQKFISLGPNVASKGLGAHGVNYSVADMYEELKNSGKVEKWGGQIYPSLAEDTSVCETILKLAPETNGELSYRAFKNLEEKTGVMLADLAEKNRNISFSFEDLVKQPRRVLVSPIWSGIIEKGRTYAAFTMNIERQIPWRTLSGRQHFYLDHEGFLAYGENLPVYKPRPSREKIADTVNCPKDGISLSYLTPHGKWQIHSTYFDNLRMLTLSRGTSGLWLNPEDALKISVEDNDWVEIFNDHGCMVTRAIVSARIPVGMCIVFHSSERTISVPKAPVRGNKRAGGHNSLVRMRIKPVLLMAGYAHLTYYFNYWGPTGVNRDTHVLVRKLKGKATF